MIVLRLAAGGRIAIRADDVAAAQASPWGSMLVLAGDGSTFEVEHSLDQLYELLPSLSFHADKFILNPDLISSIWEAGGALRYRLAGGLEATQYGADLHQFVEAVEGARLNRKGGDLGLSG